MLLKRFNRVTATINGRVPTSASFVLPTTSYDFSIPVSSEENSLKKGIIAFFLSPSTSISTRNHRRLKMSKAAPEDRLNEFAKGANSILYFFIRLITTIGNNA
jgi:hypothetical protein